MHTTWKYIIKLDLHIINYSAPDVEFELDPVESEATDVAGSGLKKHISCYTWSTSYIAIEIVRSHVTFPEESAMLSQALLPLL